MKECIAFDDLIKAGVSQRTISRHLSEGKWACELGPKQGKTGQRQKLIVVETISPKYQAAVRAYLLKQSLIEQEQSQINRAASDPEPEPLQRDIHERLSTLQAALLRYPLIERDAWLREIERLGKLIEKYDSIDPKRRVNKTTGKPEFLASINDICEEAVCTDQTILAREPRRAQRPSPHTLDGWLRSYRKDGLLAFVRMPGKKAETDNRKAKISEAAAEWVNQNWRSFRSPRALYRALEKKAKKERWTIPSEIWIYRKWESLPKPVKVKHIEGEKAYVSKYAPYVPRDYSDLDALQVLCGDHSQRDVFVLMHDNLIARPWFTVWLDLRTYLVWGWHLDSVPSSHTVGAAYANGVRTFGAQPFSRPAENYFSYWYTDQGKDYKSRNFNNEITVHRRAFNLEGGIEVMRVQQKVGYLNDNDVKRILARGYNAREKAVERIFRDFSDWEENTFDEYCGRNTVDRPDRFRRMYADHQQFMRGKRGESPFIGFEEYREALAGFIQEWNSKEHERATLGGARIVPLEEFGRLYTVRYEIPEDTLAMLLMKPAQCMIRKNGVRVPALGKDFYACDEMIPYKGNYIEVRWTPDDYDHVWCILPDNPPETRIVQARRVVPTSLINPNQEVIRERVTAQARERKYIREYEPLNSATLRIEENTQEAAQEEEEPLRAVASGGSPARVQKLTRFDGPKQRAIEKKPVTAKDVAAVEADESIFDSAPQRGRVIEMWEKGDGDED